LRVFPTLFPAHLIVLSFVAILTALFDKVFVLLNGVMGLNGEAGEVIDMVKKMLFQGHTLDKDHMAKELGDCG
jgi:NTP pyrophosphatase (non-canonical NTP hydrolase)